MSIMSIMSHPRPCSILTVTILLSMGMHQNFSRISIPHRSPQQPAASGHVWHCPILGTSIFDFGAPKWAPRNMEANHQDDWQHGETHHANFGLWCMFRQLAVVLFSQNFLGVLRKHGFVTGLQSICGLNHCLGSCCLNTMFSDSEHKG